MDTKHILSLRAHNKFGVLTRIITQIRREGCNINSLAVAETLNPKISRINMNIECYDFLLDDIIDRLSGLSCVIDLIKYDETFISREMAMISIKNSPTIKVLDLLNEYGAKPCQEADNIFEITALPQKITSLMDELKRFEDIEIARTGSVIIKSELL